MLGRRFGSSNRIRIREANTVPSGQEDLDIIRGSPLTLPHLYLSRTQAAKHATHLSILQHSNAGAPTVDVMAVFGASPVFPEIQAFTVRNVWTLRTSLTCQTWSRLFRCTALLNNITSGADVANKLVLMPQTSETIRVERCRGQAINRQSHRAAINWQLKLINANA